MRIEGQERDGEEKRERGRGVREKKKAEERGVREEKRERGFVCGTRLIGKASHWLVH